jgi:hypothetical protein
MISAYITFGFLVGLAVGSWITLIYSRRAMKGLGQEFIKIHNKHVAKQRAFK